MLDFMKKPKAQPPARMLAQTQAIMKAKKLPQEWAGLLAVRMETSAEVEKLVPVLENIRDLFAATNENLADALPMMEAALEQLGAGAAETDEDETDPAKQLLAAVTGQIAAARAQRNPVQPRFGTSKDWNSPAAQNAKMIDKLTSLFDRQHQPTIGRDLGDVNVSDIAVMCLRQNGHRPVNKAQAVRMALTTSDFPLITENAMYNTIARRMDLRQPDILRAATKITNMDYNPSKSLTLSTFAAVSEVGETGEIKHSVMDEKGERKPSVRDFAGKFNISNKALVNDHHGLFDQAAARMVDACIPVQRAVLLKPLLENGGLGQLMADGKTLFHADHRNLAPAGTALSVSSLSDARTALRKQKGMMGELLSIEPFALVVPAELETEAQQLVAEIQATKFSDTNPFSGKLEIIVEPGLEDPAAWYLIGNPSQYEGLTWATLDGMDSPRVESRAGWDTLGMEFRVTWALDAAFTETATWYRNPGE